MAKIVDTLRNILNNDPQKLRQHTLVEERPIESYLLDEWKWNEGRYNMQRSVKELVDTLIKVGGHISRSSLFRDTDFSFSHFPAMIGA